MNSQAPAVRHLTCMTLALLLALALLAQSAGAAQRKVLGEQFTAEWCSFCQVVRTASSMLIDNYADDLVMYQGHVNYDGYDIPWTNYRWSSYYGQIGIPDVWFDGTLNHHGGGGTPQDHYDIMALRINQRLAISTDITLEVGAEFISGRTFLVSALMHYEGDEMRAVDVYMLPILDHWPTLYANYRNCVMQAATEDTFLLFGNDTILVQNEITFDLTSWSRQEDIKVFFWVQARGAPPYNSEVYNADKITWPFPQLELCPADINADNVVDVLDLLAVIAAWGATSGPEDVNGDGLVDVLDLLAIIAAWGDC